MLFGYHLHYRYTAGNTSHESVNVRVGPTTTADEAKYPANSPVTVYYNPQNPSEAYLENTLAIPWGPITVIGFLGGFIVIALLAPVRTTR
jgi:hypothetical protein